MCKTVTELIGNEFKKWNRKEIVFIEAGTGQGKSHFIKNTLYDYAKSQDNNILLLSNRTNLLNQNKLELQGKLASNVVDLYNYQKIDYQDRFTIDDEHKAINLDDYKYIVCDECHYFLDDASFNKFTDISLKSILSSSAIKIFMSATPRLIRRYIENELHITNIKHYQMKNDYTYISQLFMFNDDECIEDELLRKLDDNEKVLYFHHSATKCYELHNKFHNSLFLCGKSNELYKNVDKEAIEDMLRNCKFNQQILFTTKCMDNGVNLIDRSIKHIIIDMKMDVDTIIQCLGRKRIIDKNDTVNVYIKNVSNTSLGGIKQGNNNKLLVADELDWSDEKEYIFNNQRNHKDSLVYLDCENGIPTLKVNRVMYAKYEDDMLVANALLNMAEKSANKIDKKYPFAKFIKAKLGCNWFLYDNLHEIITLDKYLADNVGVRLFKEQQEYLKEMFDSAGLKVKSGNKIGINTMNGYLKDNDYAYNIITERCTIDKVKATYWQIISI